MTPVRIEAVLTRFDSRSLQGGWMPAILKILLRDNKAFNRYITEIGLKPAYNKNQPLFVQGPVSYPAIAVLYRTKISGGLTAAEFLWEYVYPLDFEAPSYNLVHGKTFWEAPAATASTGTQSPAERSSPKKES
jgi:hypothetical protein